MNKEFISYEQALAIKELGFDEPCFGVYSEHDKTRVYDEDVIREGLKIQAPLHQQVFRWFREKYKIEGEVRCIRFGSKRFKGYQYAITSKNYQKFEQMGDYHTYEEAEFECIEKLIEIVKTQKR